MSEAFPHNTCSSCRLEFNSGDSTVNCPQCGAVYHRFCWKERGGCTAPGCAGTAAVEEEATVPPARAAGRRWLLVKAVLVLIIVAVTIGLLYRQEDRRPRALFMQPHFVFQASFNGRTGLMTLDGGDKRPRPLLPLEVKAYAADPWEGQVAVVNDDGLFLVDPRGAGGTQTKLADDAEPVNPVYTPDGKVLIYVAGDNRIVVHMLEGEAPDRIITAKGEVTELAIAPNGKALAVIAGKRLYLAQLDGSQSQELAPNATSPLFAPNGAAILCVAKDAGDRFPCLYRIDLDGKKTRLPDGKIPVRGPAISPDGKMLAFISNGEVGVLSPAGGAVTYLTHGDTGATEVSFTPDSRAVTYTGIDGLFRVPLKGGKPERLLETPVQNPAWVDLPAKGGAPASSLVPLPAIPDGYALAFTVSADFDGDGKAETAYGAAPIMPEDHGMPMSNDPPTFVLVAKDGKVIFREKDSGLTLKHLAARDLTGDGTPELLYTWESMGASDGVDSTYIFQWKDSKFRNIIGTEGGSLSHMLEGGLIFQPGKPGKPATLILYDFIWADNESHADPHRYWAEWYTLKNGKFALSKKRETKKRYYDEDPMAEFGTFTGERY
ncbi:MAG: RING finger protein [Armatimonadota bacterium]